MKKILTITSLLVLTGFSAFSQASAVSGSVAYAGFLHGIWYTNSTYQGDQNQVAVALLFAPSGTAAPTMPMTASSTNSLLNTYNTSTAWTDIANSLTAGYFYIQGTNGQSPAVALVTGTTGTFSYNTGAGWFVNAGSASTAYSCYEVAWNTVGGLYLTPTAASNAGVAVGWSQEFTYTTGLGSTLPTTLAAGNVGYFGVGGVVTSVPEPSTFALAALGGASLLLFRRRK